MDRGRILRSAHGREAALAGAAAALGAVAICGALLLAAGHDPWRAMAAILRGAFGSADGIAETLARSVPLAIAGLGVAVAFRAGAYNIGADGQLICGAILGVAAIRAAGDLGLASGLWLLVAAALGGALYGGLAGWLRARFDANEIIVTIMLNYVAVQLLAWLIRGPMQEPARIIPRSGPIPEAAQLPALFAQAHAGILLAVAASLLLHWLLRHHGFGYRIDAVGESRAAAEYGGIAGGRTIVAAMAVSGALCGLAGGVEVAGVFHRLEENMAPGAGVTAIAVALLARLQPAFVPLTALIFGALTVGTAALQRQMGVPFPLLWIIDAVVILAFLTAGLRRRAAPRPA